MSVVKLTLYWFENFLFTNWFIRDVLPTPLSPRMITFRRTFLRVAMVQERSLRQPFFAAAVGEFLKRE